MMFSIGLQARLFIKVTSLKSINIFQAFKVTNKEIRYDYKLKQFKVSGGFEAFVYSWF